MTKSLSILGCALAWLWLPLWAWAQPATTNQPPGAPSLRRWFELQTVQLQTRYLYRQDSARNTTADAIQHKETFQGRFKFDRQGNFSLTARVQSGNRFTAAWNNFSYGTGKFATNLYLKHWFFTARPLKGVEYSLGGFDVLRGQGTEISTYDNDAYVTGQRLVIKRPQELWFDEAAVTFGYLGDLTTPNLNKRYHRLKQYNYHQFMVSKNFNAHLAGSADYTFVGGVETLHQAVKLKAPTLKFLDSVTFEAYERLDVNPAVGFAAHGEKTLRHRVTVEGGYADIDRRLLPTLNADRLFTGQHVFLNNTLTLTPELSLNVFLARQVAAREAVPIKRRFEIGLTFNLLKVMQKAGLFK